MTRENYGACVRHHDLIVELAAQGRPDHEIAARIGTTPSAVGAHRRKHLIQKAPQQDRQRGPVGACELHHETVVRMAGAGATLDAIGRAVGTTKNRVRGYLARQGIERPAWREPPEGGHPMSRQTGGPLNPSWKGGRTVDKDGYVLLWMPGHPDANHHGQVREHRLVMSQVLGRPLLPGEVVDHRNDVRDDNRPENLRLFSSNGEHLSVTETGRKSRESRGLSPSTRKRSGTGGPQ